MCAHTTAHAWDLSDVAIVAPAPKRRAPPPIPVRALRGSK